MPIAQRRPWRKRSSSGPRNGASSANCAIVSREQRHLGPACRVDREDRPARLTVSAASPQMFDEVRSTRPTAALAGARRAGEGAGPLGARRLPRPASVHTDRVRPSARKASPCRHDVGTGPGWLAPPGPAPAEAFGGRGRAGAFLVGELMPRPRPGPAGRTGHPQRLDQPVSTSPRGSGRLHLLVGRASAARVTAEGRSRRAWDDAAHLPVGCQQD